MVHPASRQEFCALGGSPTHAGTRSVDFSRFDIRRATRHKRLSRHSRSGWLLDRGCEELQGSKHFNQRTADGQYESSGGTLRLGASHDCKNDLYPHD